MVLNQNGKIIKLNRNLQKETLHDESGKSGYRSERIEDCIIESIEHVLLRVFGEKVFRKIIRFMKNKYFSGLKDVPEKPYVFRSTLTELLGVGSTIITDLILEDLYYKLELDLKWKEGHSFSDYITEAKRHVLSKQESLRVSDTAESIKLILE